MKTGFLFSWTAVLMVGLASGQTPGTSPAPAGSTPPAQGAASSPNANSAASGGASAGTANAQGMWDDSANGAGGKCGLLCGRPWAGHHGPYAPDGCLENNQAWVEVEYLLWRVHDSTPPEVAELFAGTGVNPSTGLDSSNARSGIRLNGGFWFDESHCLGIDASVFYLDMKRSFRSQGTIDVSQAGIANIPPRVVVNLPVDTAPDLDPGDLLTSITTGTTTFRLWGADANLRRTVWWYGGFSFDVLVGFRQLNLDETLTLGGDFTFSEPNPDESSPGPEDGRTVHMSTVDTLQTHNQFYGGQVGASFAWHFYRVTLDGLAKFAVGGLAQQIISGGTTNVDAGLIEPSPGAPFLFRPAVTLPGGLISTTPMTTTNRTRLSVLPELRVSLGYQVTPNIRGFVGYNFMWLTNAAVIGDQTSTSTTGTRDIWFQGLDFGVQVRF